MILTWSQCMPAARILKEQLKLVSKTSGGEIIGKTTIDQGFTGEWAKYENLLYARKTDDKARLVIKLKGKGTVDLDMVSLFPEKAWNGILRCDLVKLMKDFKPGFLRFPGGCIVEGDSFENIYRWKNTIGDPARRRGNL